MTTHAAIANIMPVNGEIRRRQAVVPAIAGNPVQGKQVDPGTTVREDVK